MIIGGRILNNGKNRASLLGVVALYLLYLSYELFQGRNDPNTTMTPAARILFIALFVISAGGILFYAFRVWQRSGQEEDEQQPPEDDKNTLK